MSFKVKHMIFGKIAIILCLCLVLNNALIIKSYADDAIATQNPLFIPITTFVTAGLIGSGMIVKNSQDALNAGGQLVNNIITQIKSSEIAKSEANADYDSPYRVISGGQPEKPNNSNKNGKWVAVAGGALASNEIYANKDAIKDIMSKANSLGGYNSSYTENGIISASDLLAQSSASNISLQLAKISNSAVTQFDKFLHSNFFDGKDYDDYFYNVSVRVADLNSAEPKYPRLGINLFKKVDDFSQVRITGNPFKWRVVNTQNLSYSGYYVDFSNNYATMLNSDSVALNTEQYTVIVNPRQASEDFTYYTNSSSNNPYFKVYFSEGYKPYFYFGYVWTYQNPIQFTNNVYNVNMTFDENFQKWVQGQIQGLGGQIIEAVRLGLTTVDTSWHPTQEQIQEGTSPSSVIYQFINNYENPDNIPDEEEDPDNPVVVPPAVEEPQPTNDYLGNFLLPESITAKFPFCIPFDIARCLRLFSTSQREAPKWECDLKYGSSTYHVVIDLEPFNDLANFIRPLEYILFLVGLAIGTRSLMRG